MDERYSMDRGGIARGTLQGSKLGKSTPKLKAIR